MSTYISTRVHWCAQPWDGNMRWPAPASISQLTWVANEGAALPKSHTLCLFALIRRSHWVQTRIH
jgi:hypothetical protein